MYCAWAEATSDAATSTTRAVRDTDVVVPLSQPEVPRVGRILLSTTSESCVSRCVREYVDLCVFLCVSACVCACVIILPGREKFPYTVGHTAPVAK